MSWHRLTQVGPGDEQVRRYLHLRRRPNANGGSAVALEGVWALERAVAARVVIEAVFVCVERVRGEDTSRVVEAARAAGARTVRVSERVLLRMVERDGPDGVAAIAHLPPGALDGLSLAPSMRIVVMDHAEIAGNVGAVVRCADAAGATAVVLTDRSVRVTHPHAVKASMGTVFSMPVIETSSDEAIAWARGNGVRIVAADPAASVSYRDVDLRGRVMLVVGSERYGLSAAWREAADTLVRIPMLGHADSLNVGHATALLLYEAVHHQEASGRG